MVRKDKLSIRASVADVVRSQEMPVKRSQDQQLLAC